MTLSFKAKQALKTALAMTLSYYIALSMDWDKPYWAGLAVAFVSLNTIGASFNKIALRIAGTGMAIAVALTLIGLFAQERFAFMAALSLYGVVCVTMMMRSPHYAYYWNVGWFVVVIICMSAGPDPARAFDLAMLRAQENGLGILVYSLVAVFLWPSSSRGRFEPVRRELAQNQLAHCRAVLAGLRGEAEAPDLAKAHRQELQAQSLFDQVLDAAETESAEIRDARGRWRGYRTESATLSGALTMLGQSLPEAQKLDLQRLFPGLPALEDAVTARLAAPSNGKQGPPQVQPADLSPDREALRKLPHLQRAVAVVIRDQLRELDRTGEALAALSAEGAEADTDTRVARPPIPASASLLDVETLVAAVRLLLLIWLSFMAVIYIDDLPGGFSVVSITLSTAITFVTMPQFPVSQVYAPAATAALFSAALYMLVMPHLSGFRELAPLIFGVTFAIGYLFAEPQQMIGRTVGLAVFLVMSSIDNEQSYHFLVPVNTAMLFPIMLLMFVISVYFPFNLQPQAVFRSQLRRLLRSAAYLLAQPDTPPQTRVERWKLAFHRHEVATLPVKLPTWVPRVTGLGLAGTTPEQLQALVTAAQVLSARVLQLSTPTGGVPPRAVYPELAAELSKWRSGMRRLLQQLADDPGAARGQDLEALLHRASEHIEQRIVTGIESGETADTNAQQAEPLYRELARYRFAAEAVVECATNAACVDWEPWTEARFA
jgi:uncharacterized membrane protein YccC